MDKNTREKSVNYSKSIAFFKFIDLFLFKFISCCKQFIVSSVKFCSDIDDCANHPCQNGGNRTDLLADYNCSCPFNSTGKNCSIGKKLLILSLRLRLSNLSSKISPMARRPNGIFSFISETILYQIRNISYFPGIYDCANNVCQSNGKCVLHVQNDVCRILALFANAKAPSYV